jgi:hypothetical protein
MIERRGARVEISVGGGRCRGGSQEFHDFFALRVGGFAQSEQGVSLA